MSDCLKFSMNLLDGDIMDTTDLQLRKFLKNWVARHQPPANGHARLLEQAAFPKTNCKKTTSFEFAAIPNELFSWVTVYSMERGMVALRLVS
jgi:hypothetical protein